MSAIDVHTHILPRGWEDFAARFGGERWPRLVGDPATSCQLYVGATFNRNLGPEAFDPARRLEDMDACGIARQLLSPAPPLFCYWAPGAAASEWCRMVNDAIAEAVSRHPSRFLGAGGLPLQAPDLAVKELERVATTLRFPAVEIGASVEGRDLDDPALAPVWEAAVALGVAVFVHPQAPVVGQERVQRQNLTQVIGFPLETALCLTRLVFGGVLERWPGIRWCFAHGGGAFASVVARLDHGWRVMDEARAAIPRAPSEYARGVWVDTLTHSPRTLALVLDTFGPGRVVLGSDYPFRLGTEDPVAALTPAALDAGLRRRLLADNALSFLGLPGE
ncbi:MAG TPA: amidohydrolase family protein [Methylomirabilota bacterium]|jgi:aminocarboxymuconate-semialdehyde decarboxylase|nr:amidohydrolase family protein [Methylomirabilota bacterium]